MCKLKSAIILKDRIFIPDYDHHSKMLEELKIEDTRKNAEKLFVRAELSPIDGDIFTSVDTWEFNVDQDIVPEWFVKDYEEQRMRASVEKWHKEHVFIGIDNLELERGDYYLKNCKRATFKNSTVTAWGNSTVTAWENSTVTARENSTVTARENSTVTARENSTVTAWGNSTVTAWENSTVTARENSTVTARENSTAIIPNYSSNKKENIVLCDNSTLKDCTTSTVYQSGNFKLVLVNQ